MATSQLDTATDTELVHCARAGDVRALGSLLTRHRPALLATAIGLLGYGPDAEDAVQETCLIALRRIGDVRDPAAVGSWLRMVTRNVCRMRHRATEHLPLDTGLAAVIRSAEPDPTELLGQHAMRDWVWQAMEELSPPLRLVVMLRYFSGVTAYQDIAEMCGVPVGTVRSRLNEARSKLSRALLATADAAHGDIRAFTAERRRGIQDLMGALYHGDALAGSWLRDAPLDGPGGLRAEGHDFLRRAFEQDMTDGVTYRLDNVVASGDITVCEFTLFSPPEDPFHCPPGVAWILHQRSGWVERMRLFHLRRQSPEHVRVA